MSSLRSRLLLAVVGTSALLWLVGALLVIDQVWRGDAMWEDLSPREAAEHVLRRVRPHASMRASLRDAAVALPPWFQGEYQVWNREGLALRSSAAPYRALKPDFRDGSGRETVEGEVWWVYSLADRSHGLHVQVGRRHRAVEHDVRVIAGFSRVAVAALTITWAIAMFVIIHASLRSTRALVPTLERRESSDMRPLPLEHLPDEVRPLVEAFNVLLGRLEHALDAERRFLADAAHELRTPLAALSLQAQLAMQAQGDAERVAALHELGQGVTRTSRLAEQLLSLARVGARHDRRLDTAVDLAMLVAIVARDLEVLIEAQSQSLILDLEPSSIDGNVDELGMLIRNLMDNAIRYSGPNGTIRVACKTDARSGAVTLLVSDDGPGVPIVERERIFERFYRVAGTGRRGSGIGLSLVQQIARAHGAVIETHEGIGGRGLGISVYFTKS